MPIVINFWNAAEILGHWNFFQEIWIEPMKYVLEVELILLAFIVVSVAVMFIAEKNAHIIHCFLLCYVLNGTFDTI